MGMGSIIIFKKSFLTNTLHSIKIHQRRFHWVRKVMSNTWVPILLSREEINSPVINHYISGKTHQKLWRKSWSTINKRTDCWSKNFMEGIATTNLWRDLKVITTISPEECPHTISHRNSSEPFVKDKKIQVFRIRSTMGIKINSSTN